LKRESEREAFFLIAAWMDGWMGQTNKNRLTGGERERERERERPFLFLFYIGLIEEKYAITAAAALSCVVLWYDNERIINRGQER
jgi:hypothetical protein